MRLDPFAVDLDRGLETAAGAIDRREGLFVGVEGEGARGVGEATPLPGWTESLDDCRAALAGATPASALDCLASAPAARHGLSLATLDRHAREAGEPLARWLGGDHRTTVPVNATVGDADPAETATRAARAVEAGFDCLKIKVGAGPLDRDVQRLRSARAAAGEAAIRADANGAWDRTTAERAVAAFADAGVGLAYLEQPLPADDLSGHAVLRDADVAVALDESLLEFSLEEIFDSGAADVVVLKPMALGGVDRAHDAAGMARERGVDPVVTTTVDAAVARAAAAHVAATVPDVRPCGLVSAGLPAGEVEDPAPVVDGRIELPAGPGIAGETFDRLLWRE